MKYLSDRNRHWTEYIFWTVALISSIFFCSLLIIDAYRKWQDAPFIVNLSEKPMNIWEIPFVAITICPVGGLTPLNDSFGLAPNFAQGRLNKFTGSIESRITNVEWRKSSVNSHEFFTEIATEEGFCWTFNTYNFDDLFKKAV